MHKGGDMERHESFEIEKVLREIIQQEDVSTQLQLHKLLKQRGIKVDQSTISRLLRKIAAVKARDVHGQSIYRLGEELLPLSPQVSLGELVSVIAHNENMIIIRTSPGAASLIARYLDYHRDDLNLLGSIAGDDTVFVMPERIKMMQKTVNGISQALAQVKFNKMGRL